MKKSIRNILCIVLVITMFALTACSEAAPAPNSSEASKPQESSSAPQQTETNGEPDVLHIATTPHIASAAIWAADRLGFFAEENLRIETTSFPAMAPAIAALASGDIDISYMGVGVHSLAAQGQVRIFAVNNLSYGDFFLGNKQLGVESLEDLKGKTIAVNKGSTGDMLVNMVLKSNGLDPADYNIVNMDMAGVVAAMTAGKIDACGAWEPFVSEISEKLGEENLVYLGAGKDYTDQIAFIGSYGANEKMFNEKRDQLVRFTRAYLKATDYLMENPEELIKITMEETQGSEASIRAQADVTKLFGSEEFAQVFEDGTALAWYDSLINGMVDTGVLDEAVPAENFVDTDIIKEAME